MDQAISLMGRLGVAMNIDFNPVRAADVPVPADGTFVIANSLAGERAALPPGLVGGGACGVRQERLPWRSLAGKPP